MLNVEDWTPRTPAGSAAGRLKPGWGPACTGAGDQASLTAGVGASRGSVGGARPTPAESLPVGRCPQKATPAIP